jgi:predicted aconitase with swiveling domain
MEIKGRIIFNGMAEGEALVTKDPISFYGGVDPETGVIIELGHELEGKSMSGKILVFPKGKGSTVGSYVMYRLKKNGNAPMGIINKECETIVAVGAIISEIPLIDKLEENVYDELNGKTVIIDGDKIIFD